MGSTTPTTVYSGVAAADLAPDSTVLEIICPGITPGALEGTLDKGITTNTISLKDRTGAPITGTVTSSNHIVATWAGESNQRYPPLVRKGEPVKVERVADQDKFTWRATGSGRSFRTTDRVHFEVGATDPTKPGVEKDDTNTYSACLDSHNKVISVKSAKANGEACAFNMTADLAAGTFFVSDDTAGPGNRIYLDTGTKSGSPVFQVNISDGTAIKFQNGNIFVSAPKGVFISSKERIVFDSPLTVMNLSKAGAVIINAANIALNAASGAVITAGGVFGVNAAASKIAGMLATAALRVSSFAHGGVGGAYQPVSVGDPSTGSAVTPSNVSDEDTSNIVSTLPVS
jgi:hypothetical protein